MAKEDWETVSAIYKEGIATKIATFETEVPDYGTWDQSHMPESRLVAKFGNQVVGWAALSPISNRCAYAGVAEASVYVSKSAHGKGVGKMLLMALVDGSERAGIWTLQAGMFPENVASLALHRACGFREVGMWERVGQLQGVWKDVVRMERRSKIVGGPKNN
jgi:phosphinothricin acetyltransferase